MNPLLTIPVAFTLLTATAWADTVVKPDPWKTREYSVLAIEGRFAAYIGPAPVILDSKLRASKPKTYSDAIHQFGPAFISRFSSIGRWEWHFDDGKIYRVDPPWNSGLNEAIDLSLRDTHVSVIEVENK